MSKQNRSWFQKYWFPFSISIGLGIIVSALIALGVWGSFQLDEEKRPDFIAKLVSTAATVVGGVVLYLNFRNAQRNTKLAEERFESEIDRAAREGRLATSRLLAERFSQAIEQLGSDQITGRLGGIYSLEKLAKDSPQEYYGTVMEVLTTFIRAQSSTLRRTHHQQELRPISVDIQAALTVTGRRELLENISSQKLNLSHTNLTEAQFQENLSFEHFLFEGACFNGAYLSNIELSHSNLNKARLNNVNSLNKGLTVKAAKLNSTQLVEAEIIGSQLSRADFSNANLHKANLSSSNFYKANFVQAKLGEAILDKANLSSANFQGANLSGTSLVGADLHGANFTDAEGLSIKQLEQAKNYQHALQWITPKV